MNQKHDSPDAPNPKGSGASPSCTVALWGALVHYYQVVRPCKVIAIICLLGALVFWWVPQGAESLRVLGEEARLNPAPLASTPNFIHPQTLVFQHLRDSFSIQGGNGVATF